MSVINDYVENLDMNVCSKRLTDKIKECIDREDFTPDFCSNVMGIGQSRFNYLMVSNGKDMKREEIECFCFIIGYGLDYSFCLPDLSDRDLVLQEYNEIKDSDEFKEESSFCDSLKEESRKDAINTLRSVLYLNCLRRCLSRYPSYLTKENAKAAGLYYD